MDVYAVRFHVNVIHRNENRRCKPVHGPPTIRSSAPDAPSPPARIRGHPVPKPRNRVLYQPNSKQQTNNKIGNDQITSAKFQSTLNFTGFPQNGHKQIKRLHRADCMPIGASGQHTLLLGPPCLPAWGPLFSCDD
jgi:hypothetical protein